MDILDYLIIATCVCVCIKCHINFYTFYCKYRKKQEAQKQKDMLLKYVPLLISISMYIHNLTELNKKYMCNMGSFIVKDLGNEISNKFGKDIYNKLHTDGKKTGKSNTPASEKEDETLQDNDYVQQLTEEFTRQMSNCIGAQ